MKTKDFNNLKILLEKIKNITWIERVIYWRPIRSLSYDAYDEFKSLDNIIEDNKEKLQKYEQDNKLLNKDIENYKEKINDSKSDIKIKDNTVYNLNKEISEKDKIIAKSEKEYETHRQTHQKSIDGFDSRRKQLEDERLEEQKQIFEKMKETWQNHEKEVERVIKDICKRNQISYLSKEKIEIKGKPDNTIKIIDEYVIFDAKSPANDNLDNFPKYLVDQTKRIEKYIKEKNVKKIIYLVIPLNTVSILKQFVYEVNNYKVFIVTIDSLESIILSLKEVEKYHFVDKLSPEDRNQICDIIGRYANTTKRKIEIDNIVNHEFLKIADSCNDLNPNIKKSAVEYEKAYALNPPMAKKGKLLDLDKLDEDIKVIDHKRVLKQKKLLGKKK